MNKFKSKEVKEPKKEIKDLNEKELEQLMKLESLFDDKLKLSLKKGKKQ